MDDIDGLSREGAMRLALAIERYWLARGYRGIQVRLERFFPKDISIMELGFAVRSNIGPNGFPPLNPATSA